MSKLSYDEALESLNDERNVSSDSVLSSALNRVVWVMSYSAPGCIPDFRSIGATKKEILETAVSLYEMDSPRGFLTSLRKHNCAPCDERGYYRVTLEKLTLADLLD